jgi:hypothetical protein
MVPRGSAWTPLPEAVKSLHLWPQTLQPPPLRPASAARA